MTTFLQLGVGLLFNGLNRTKSVKSNLQGYVILFKRVVKDVHARNRGAAPQDGTPYPQKVLTRIRFGCPEMLRSGKCDTDNLKGDLDGFDFQASENPKNLGHNFILRLTGQLATDLQGNWFCQTHNDAADSSE